MLKDTKYLCDIDCEQWGKDHGKYFLSLCEGCGREDYYCLYCIVEGRLRRCPRCEEMEADGVEIIKFTSTKGGK